MLDVALLWPGFGSETVWTPRGFEWLIYAHHEGGTDFAGSWLVQTIKDLWPNWERHQWTSPLYVRPAGRHPRSKWQRPPA